MAVSAALNLAGEDVPDRRTPVLLLDFDLEAPGVDEFECMRPPDPNQPGLVEYVQAYRDSGCAPSIREYAYGSAWGEHHCRISYARSSLGEADGQEPEPEHAREPPSYVMRAGRRDDDHCRFLARFDWERFYAEKEGHRFFENLRAGVRSEFGCDYLLVDSRTGLTRIGGVCLGHLADAVVFVFQPTTAHSQGLEKVVRLVREREHKEERAIPRLYVASKVPMPYEDKFDEDACELAEKLVKRCEGTSEIDLWPKPLSSEYMDFEDLGWEPRAGVPALTLIRARERVPHPHDPDAYVVQASPNLLSAIEAEYGAVVHWIETARRAAAAPARGST